MRGRTYIVLSLLLSLFAADAPAGLASTGTNPSPGTLLKRADQCRKALMGSAAKRKYRHNWTRCIERYEAIAGRHPESDAAAWALYHAARLYLGLHRHSRSSKDVDEALGLNRRLAERYPKHRLADDAQYAVGEIYDVVLKDLTRAYVEYLKVEVRHPEGDMVPKAKKRLDELEAALSRQRDGPGISVPEGAHGAPVPLKDIRHWSTPNYTRVVIDLENPAQYEHRLLKGGPGQDTSGRLVVDIKNGVVSTDFERRIPIGDDLLQGARAGQYQPDTARVVLDMVNVDEYKVFHLHDPFRIVVDVRRHSGEEAPASRTRPETGRRPVTKGVRKADDPDESLSLARQLGLSVRTIVIDPGHGGKDPGCIAPGGVKEKDIVLNLAKVLAERIRQRIGCRVYLTRDRDEYLSLEQRTAIANMKKADLFISLHVNAHRDQRIWGLETYFLNMATDEHAVMVAARENATSEKNISDLQSILNDLMLNTKLHESSRLAHEIQKGMMVQVQKRFEASRSLGVKQAPFYVLIGANMPSVLVEIGFISNSRDRQRLLSGRYMETLADGVTSGIQSYIRETENIYRGG